LDYDETSQHAQEESFPDLKSLAQDLVETFSGEGKLLFMNNVMQMFTKTYPTVQLFVHIGEDSKIMIELGKLTMTYAYEKMGVLITPDMLSEDLYNTRVPLLWTGQKQNCSAIIAMLLGLALFKENSWTVDPIDLFQWEAFRELIPGTTYEDYEGSINWSHTKNLEQVDQELVTFLILPLLQDMVMYSLRNHFETFMTRVDPGLYSWLSMIMDTELHEIMDEPTYPRYFG
jgi:hypothetical protein